MIGHVNKRAELLDIIRATPEWKPPEEETTVETAEEEAESSWPVLADEALHGLAGEIVQLIEPHTESDPVALLVQLLTGFGSVIGRTAHFRVEETEHYLQLFAVLVGETSRGRKGTSWQHVNRLMSAIDKKWAEGRVLSGLASGEGLTWAVRDPIEKVEPIKEKGRITDYQNVIIDEGYQGQAPAGDGARVCFGAEGGRA